MTRTDAPAGDLWIRLVRSTGLKMFVILTLALLPRVKGGILGLMWFLGLRGDETQ